MGQLFSPAEKGKDGVGDNFPCNLRLNYLKISCDVILLLSTVTEHMTKQLFSYFGVGRNYLG